MSMRFTMAVLTGLVFLGCASKLVQRLPAEDTSTYSVVANDGTNPFGLVQGPSAGDAKIYGGYANGCISGASVFPIEGKGYEVVRNSRHRFYGHPSLLSLLARAGAALGTASPILVADLSQARGGPMATGHASHQIGLDADIWILQLDKPFTEDMRESLSAESVLKADGITLDPALWKPFYEQQILWFAGQPEVERIFMNVAIKKHMCEAYPGDPRLLKMRPWYEHNDHFHVRLKCPADQPSCVPQRPSEAAECEPEKMASWYEPAAVDRILHPKPTPVYSVTLPVECKAVVTAP